jgi:Domain of unknown function (DUF4333)
MGLVVGFASISLTGCSTITGLANGGTVLDARGIERSIVDWFAENDTEIATVECPATMTGVTGDSWLCVATDPWDFAVNVRVTMTSSDGFVEWQVEY